MLSKLKYTAAAAALALTPFAVSAATVVNDGGTYDVLADSYEFQESYDVGESGDTLTFTFENTSGADAAVTFFGVTVQQNTAVFDDGVSVDFGTYSETFDEGDSGGDNTTFTIAAGDSATLTIMFGDVVDTGPTGGSTDIDFTVEAAVVPVPAAGLLLLSALGGAVALRRRKNA